MVVVDLCTVADYFAGTAAELTDTEAAILGPGMIEEHDTSWLIFKVTTRESNLTAEEFLVMQNQDFR